MRRLIALASTLLVTAGIGLAAAPPASAASLGTVTVDYNPYPTWAITPSFLSGVAGDTFDLQNMRNNTNCIGSNCSYVSITGDTGSVSGPYNITCATATDCKVYDSFSPPSSETFTVITPGTFTIYRSTGGGAPASIGTLTIGNTPPAPGPAATPAPTFTLTYNANGGACNVSSSGAVVSSSWVKVPDEYQCTRAGLTLTGFSTSPTNAPGSTFIPAGGSTQVTGDNTLYAQWKVRVIADSTANECPGNVTTDVNPGQPVTLPAAKVCGDRILVGWSAFPGSGASVKYQPGQTINPTASETIWGVWAPVRTVTLVCTVAAGSPSQQVSVGREHPMVLPTECSGAQVGKWTTARDGTGTSTTAGDTFRTSENVALYAQADGTEVTVTWNANGGSCPAASTKVAWGSTFAPAACTRTGYTVTDWRTAATGGTSLVGTPLRASTTAYPVWTQTPVLGAIWTFKCLTPTYVAATWNATAKQFEVTLPTNTACDNAPYALASWNTQADGSGTTYAPGATVPITEPTWVTAQWGAPLTFNFNTGDATCPAVTYSPLIGSEFTFPGQSACSRANSAIASWTAPNPTDPQAAAIALAPGSTNTALVPSTWTATWAPPITVTFNPDGGTCTPGKVVIGNGGVYQMPGVDNCTKAGYRLTGWAFAKDTPRDNPFFFQPGASFPAFMDLTVIAQWASTSHCAKAAGPGVDWHDCDKRGVNLTGTNFTGANLSNALFDNANLSGATLTSANLSGTSFNSTNLSNATLSYADLSGKTLYSTNFTGASLNSANLTKAMLVSVRLTRANLTSANLTGAVVASADLTNANLSNGNVTGLDLRTSKVTGINLGGATVANTNLANTDLAGANLAGARGSGLNIAGAKAGGVSLAGANLPSLSAASTVLSKATLSNAALTDANLSLTDLTDVVATNGNLSGSTLSYTKLTGANLTSVNLSTAKLSNLGLSGVNLSNANLGKATYSKVTIGTANLTGASVIESNLTDSDFSKATVRKASFNASNLTNADFSGRDVTNTDFTRATLSNLNFANAYTDKIGKGCQADGYQRNSQVKVTQGMRNLPTVPWVWVEAIWNRKGTKLLRNETHYENRTWGMDGPDFLIYCARQT